MQQALWDAEAKPQAAAGESARTPGGVVGLHALAPGVPEVLGDLPLAARAHAAIDRLMDEGHPCVVAFSSGKDSSVVANLVLTVAAARAARGATVPPILVVHSDTGVENPEVRRLADGELSKIARFAREHGIPVEIRVGRPLLYSSWPLMVLSGRALPAYANNKRDCSVEWKVKVGRRLTAQAFESLAGGRLKAKALRQAAEHGTGAVLAAPSWGAPVVMTGVRRSESTARGAAITERGETEETIWHDDAGRSFMSPILSWDVDDVWEYLGYANAGAITGYSDFADTMQFYRDAGGSSCVVVGDMRIAERQASEKGGCGARSGCWTCVRVQKDESLETMIASDPARYGYMRGLNELRDFIAKTQYDWSRRNFIGRTIDKDGCIEIQADTFAPRMLEDLLRMVLTLQAQENAEAARLRIAPRFSVIGPRELIGIDAMWSLYGLHPPFHALHVAAQVDRGALLFPPAVSQPPRTPPPRLGKLFVGSDWDSEVATGEPARDRLISGGIRHPILEMFQDSCGVGPVQLRDGTLTTGYATAEAFDVDEEAAADFLGCGLADEQIARFHDARGVMWTEGVRFYLSMGLVQPADGGLGRWHRIAKRTDWLQRHGLNGQVEPEELARRIQQQAQGDAAEMDDAPRMRMRMRA